jgi:hypothetical protein
VTLPIKIILWLTAAWLALQTAGAAGQALVLAHVFGVL